MEQTFLYQRWLSQRLHEYTHSSHPPKLRGRSVTMSPTQYGAALMQAYLGKANLNWIAEQTRIPLQQLKEWRREPEFLLVMDWSKSVFSTYFHENLVLNDYSLAQYHHITGEVSLLEESLRVVARVPIYQRFKKLGRSLISRHQNNLILSNYDLRLFRRLFLFFLALEYHWPSSSHHRIREDFIPLAKDVVWPLLGQEVWLEPALKAIQETTPLQQIRLVLDIKLSDTLRHHVQYGEL